MWATPIVTEVNNLREGKWEPITLNGKLCRADERARQQVRGVYPKAVCQDFAWCTLVVTEPGGKVLDDGGVDGHRSEAFAWQVALRHIIRDRKIQDGRYGG